LRLRRVPACKDSRPLSPFLLAQGNINMRIQKENKLYRSSSFYAVAFLILHGLELVGVESSPDSHRSVFVLKDSPDRQKLLQVFNFAEESSPDLLVDFRRVISVVKNLKEKLYQEKV